MPTRPGDDALLQIGQVAARFAVTVGTVRRWTDAGQLPVLRTDGGHRRFRSADVEQAVRERLTESRQAARQ